MLKKNSMVSCSNCTFCTPIPGLILSRVSGPSSNVYLVRQILKTIDRESFTAQPDSPEDNPLDSIKPEDSPPCALFRVEAVNTAQPANQKDMYVLPTLSTTFYLVTIFFRDYGSMNPFLDDATFVHTHVNPIFKERRQPKPSRLALLNMVLAIATTSSIDAVKPVKRRIWLSGKFYERARCLSSRDVFGCTDIEQGKPESKVHSSYLTVFIILVQTYLLMSQYLQSTDDCSHSWATHSMAVQTALRLGLHREDSLNKYPDAEQESRRRTWHLCVLMDM